MPDISVIVPVYNVEAYLAKCLDSILAQTFNNFEVICIDDGSTDKSGSILSRYANRDSRIQVLTTPNQGVSMARNCGLKLAKGNYISFIDADDEIAPTFLEDLYVLLKMNRADIACCGYQTGTEYKKYPYETPVVKMSTEPLASLIAGENHTPMAIWNKLYAKSVLQGLHFTPKQSLGEDIIFLFQSLYAAHSIVSISTPLYFYRIRKGSAMAQSFSQKTIDNNVQTALSLHTYFKNKPLNKRDKRLLSQKIAKRLFKFCVLEPKRKDVIHIKKWYQYTHPLLKNLKEKGFYQPQYLSLKNRFKSWLFLRGKYA